MRKGAGRILGLAQERYPGNPPAEAERGHQPFVDLRESKLRTRQALACSSRRQGVTITR